MNEHDDRSHDRFKRPEDRKYPSESAGSAGSAGSPKYRDEGRTAAKTAPADSKDPDFRRRLRYARQERARGLILRLAILLFIIILFALPRVIPREDPRFVPDLTPTPDALPFTFEALVLTDELLYAVDDPVSGLVSYSRPSGLPALPIGVYGTFTYDGRVREDDPPHVTLLAAEPAENGIAHAITMEEGLELLRQTPGAYLMDARDPEAIAGTGYIPTPRTSDGIPRITFTPEDPLTLPPDSILLVYGENADQAGEAAAVLMDQGRGAVLNLGSWEDFPGELSFAERLSVLPAPEYANTLPKEPVIALDPSVPAADPEVFVTVLDVTAYEVLFRIDNQTEEELTIVDAWDLYAVEEGGAIGRWIQPQRASWLTNYSSSLTLQQGESTLIFDLWELYGVLPSGSYRVVLRTGESWQMPSVLVFDFSLDREAIREDILNTESSMTADAPAPDLEAVLMQQSLTRGGAMFSVSNNHEAWTYAMDTPPELQVYRGGSWKHYANFKDYKTELSFMLPPIETEGVNDAFNRMYPYSSVVPLYFHWQPLIGLLDPGHYRLLLQVQGGGEQHVLIMDIPITENTSMDPHYGPAHPQADREWFLRYMRADNAALSTEAVALNENILSYRVSNTSDADLFPYQPVMLKRITEPQSSVLFNPADWFVINDVYRLAEETVTSIRPGEEAHLSLLIENMLDPLMPGEYLLFMPLVPEDTQWSEAEFVSMFFIIEEEETK